MNDISITERSGNVFLDLGFPPADAEVMKLRAELASSASGALPPERPSHMKNTSSNRARDELRDEYALDYDKSRPNRFAPELKDTTTVVLQPDVAEVFQSSRAVNDLLRSAIAATAGKSPAKRPADRSSDKR